MAAETQRRGVGTILSSLFYRWMTSHPKVELNREPRMSSSEVSVSCCLSISSVILDIDENLQSGDESSEAKKNERNSRENGNASKALLSNASVENGDAEKDFSPQANTSMDIDDEDRELIIK